MFYCYKCNKHFEFEDVKALDAGPIYAVDVLGLVKQVTIRVCPYCSRQTYYKEGTDWRKSCRVQGVSRL